MELKQKAESLRKQGMTYKQISSTLDGAVSVDWCKKNLREFKPTPQVDPCMAELLTLGCRPQGITHYEANGVIYKYHPDANANKLNYIKDKAKKTDKSFIVHSGWIDPMKPNESHKAINAFALHLMDQVDSMVDYYMFSYPNANKWSVRYEMLKLAFSKQISPEPLTSRVYTNEKLAEVMEERL